MEYLNKFASDSVIKIRQEVDNLGWNVNIKKINHPQKSTSAWLYYNCQEFKSGIKKAIIYLPDENLFDIKDRQEVMNAKYGHELCHILIDEELQVCYINIKIDNNDSDFLKEICHIIESILTDKKVYNLLSQYKVDTSNDLFLKYDALKKTINNIPPNRQFNLYNDLIGLLTITVQYIVIKEEWKTKIKNKLIITSLEEEY